MWPNHVANMYVNALRTNNKIRLVWLNSWVFVYELSAFGLESSCSHLNFRFCTCFEQGVPWHSGHCRGWIHSQTHTWHDKNIQLNMSFEDPAEHGWWENGSAKWEENYFPVNFEDVLPKYENLEIYGDDLESMDYKISVI